MLVNNSNKIYYRGNDVYGPPSDTIRIPKNAGKGHKNWYKNWKKRNN